MADWIADSPATWDIPPDVRERLDAKRRGIEANRQQASDDALAAQPWVRRMRAWVEGAPQTPDGYFVVTAPRGDD
jgi:hypothetical protein